MPCHLRFVLAVSCCIECTTGQVSWTEHRVPNPTLRYGPLAYDTLRDRVVLFAGDIFVSQPDTWEWDGSRWVRIWPRRSPEMRDVHGMAYDEARALTILFGGQARSGAQLGDTWTWDGQDWRQLPVAGPSPRVDPTMVYDSTRQRIVLWGGGDVIRNVDLTDTWEWDGSQWQRCPTTRSPSPRVGPRMVYDAARGRTVLFGGLSDQPGFVPLGDTWEWDGMDWTQRQPPVSPSPRVGHSMAYDAARERVVVFGGADRPIPPLLADTWEWDGTTWRQRNPLQSPPPTNYSEMAYRHAGESVLLLHLELFHPIAQTWEYAPVHPARYDGFGTSCSRAVLEHGSRPWTADTFVLHVRNVPPGAPVLLIVGFSDTAWGNVRLPLPLDPLGMTGCVLLAAPDTAFGLVASAAGAATWSFALANDPALLGLRFFNQAFVPDPGANTLGITATAGGAGTIGSR